MTEKVAVKASEAVPLGKAYLCIECACISVPNNHKCTLCGSTALLFIAKALDQGIVSSETEKTRRNNQ